MNEPTDFPMLELADCQRLTAVTGKMMTESASQRAAFNVGIQQADELTNDQALAFAAGILYGAKHRLVGAR